MILTGETLIDRYTVIPSKYVLKKQIPLVKRSGRYRKYMSIIRLLKKNPYSHLFSGEQLYPYVKHLYSMRLNRENRVVYQIVEAKKLVKIYEVWGHYNK